MMKLSKKYISLVVMSALGLGCMAQTGSNGKFSIKASTEIGLANSFGSSSSLPVLSSKADGSNTGVDFGWIFYQKSGHILEANIGVAYSPMTAKYIIGAFDYNYAAPASADEDGNTYIRYYELGKMNQEVKVSRLTMPVYMSYAYKCNSRVKVHVDLGVGLGFKTSCKLDKVSGSAYSYGVYPQYDNLMIDAGYLNGFGTSDLSDAVYSAPEATGLSCSLLTGVGAEINIAGPVSVDLSLRYNVGLTNQFKKQYIDQSFSSESAPVSYTVAQGQSVRPMSDYINSSKLGQYMLKIGVIYRF